MELYTLVQHLAALRRDPCLARGGCRVSESGGVVTIERAHGARRIILHMNPSDTVLAAPDGTEIEPWGTVILEKEM